MYNYSFQCIELRSSERRAIAGQELVRLLARHPGRAADARPRHRRRRARPRQLPALARVWDGEVQPLDLERVIADATWRFSRFRKRRRRRSRPPSSPRGCASSICRARSACARRGATRVGIRRRPAMPEGVAYGLTEFERDAIADARLRLESRLLPDGSAARADAARRDWSDHADSDLIIDAKSGISGAGKAPSERTHFSRESRQRRGLRRVRAPPHAGNGAGARAHRDLRAASGAARSRLLSSNYVRLTPGTTADRCRQAFKQAYATAPFVRLTGTDLPESSTWPGRTSATSAGRWTRPTAAR